MKRISLVLAGVVGVAFAVRPAAAQTGSDAYSLARAIQTALENSHDITAAEFDVRVAGQQVREAWSNVMPDVSATASYSRNLRVQEAFLPAFIFDPNAGPDDVVPVRFGADNTWTAGLALNQPLFEYNVFIGVGAANRFRSLEAERLRGTTQEVVTAVRLAYLDALLASANHELLRNSVERVEKTLKETRALNRAGLTSDYDVLRLEVEVANLVPNLRRAENRVAEAKRGLLIELGLEPDQSLSLEGNLFEMDIADPAGNSPENAQLLAAAGFAAGTPLTLDQLNPVALRERSSLRQQRLNLELERTRLASQKAEYFPKLSLFTNYNITAQNNGAPDFFGSANSRTTSAVTGISISVPIFQGFSRDARVQQTHAVVDRIETQLARSEKEIENELQTYLADLEETGLRVQSQGRAVGQARRGFEIASAEYRAGVGSQLQITDAELALRQSEFNYAQAVYDFLTARVRLDDVVGTVPTAAGELVARTNP